METIGERACHAIRERSYINQSTTTSEIERLNLCRKVFNVPVMAWTVRTADEWSKCADKFDSYICEGLPKKRNLNK